ncbi:hypothetical protein Tco_0402058, partial [Tanacetum coccineum]
MELFCFVDEVFDSECVQVRVKVQQVQNWRKTHRMDEDLLMRRLRNEERNDLIPYDHEVGGVLLSMKLLISVTGFTAFCLQELSLSLMIVMDHTSLVFNPPSTRWYKGLKTKQKRYEEGFGSTRVDNSIPLRDIIARYSPSVAITSSPPDLPTEEPEDFLIMGDEHLDTILEKESDELIKSSVENLVPIPSESKDFSDNEKIISLKIDPHYFNAESNLIEYLLNRDILIDSSPKFDYLLEEFSGELAHINPIPLEELNLEIAYMILESLSPSPIPVTDSDSLMEEIDLFLASDD